MKFYPTPAIHASISGIHFFVGAGASHRISNQDHYDFPLGSSLLQGFKSVVVDADPRQLPSQQKSWATENFIRYESVDEFLRMADSLDYCALVELGKKFVDQEISSCEQKVAKYFKDRSKPLIAPWIESFLKFMTEDVDCYKDAYQRLKCVALNNNPSYPAVNFATLNYDRLIELSLKNYFARKYPDAIMQITQDFEILGNLVQHHHGSLGSLKERPFGEVHIDRSPTLKFWFELPEDPQRWSVMNAMSNIRNHSVFLGFGFHQSIAKRFDFNGSKPKIHITDARNELKSKIDEFLSAHDLDNPIITTGDNCCMELVQKLVREYSI